MAKPNRGGLGRGIGSLMGSDNETPTKQNRTTNRDRIVYDEREDVVYENNEKKAIDDGTGLAATGKIPPVGKDRNVSRETSQDRTSSTHKGTIAGLSSTGSFIPPKDLKMEEKPVINKEKPVNTEVKPEKSKQETPAEGISTDRNHAKAIKDPDVLVVEVDIEKVQPNPEQPRTSFKEEDLKELTNSIRREGLIQPILVRQKDGGYQIIAGERRWQASKRAGLTKVPVQIREVDDEKALELALIENIQRKDLNPIEEAYAYKRLMEKNQMTQADIAQAVSKGRSTIANALRLLDLPEAAQQLLFEDEITAGHARAILSVPTKEGRIKLTEKLIENKMNVRETENLAKLMSNKPTTSAKREPAPAVYKSVARSLKASLDTDVKVKSSGGKNKIEIIFTDEEDLERIFELISPE